MSRKRGKKIEVWVDEGLHEQAHKHAEEEGIGLGAVIRAFLKWWSDPKDPHPLPPGAREEAIHPKRRRPPKSGE